LHYSGNQLAGVTEIASAADRMYGFTNQVSGGSAPTEYSYNLNGAMKHDANSGISFIRYNLLNLPEQISFYKGDVNLYKYDAMGQKRQVKHFTARSGIVVPIGSTNNNYSSTSQNELTTDYLAGGSIIYANNSLKMIRTEEGYVERMGNGYRYYLYMKDHLGNNRSVVDVGSYGSWYPVQEMSYYPFGMPHPFGNYSPERQNFKFGDKELDEMHGLKRSDHHTRQLSSVLGIWDQLDPHAESYYRMSPYSIMGNNPIFFVDPDGKDIYRYDDKTGEFHLEVQNDDGFDQVGKFKYNKKTGEYTLKTNKKGEAKTRIDNVEKGILSDGINFKENNNVIDVGGTGQATVAGVENFLLDFSNMIDKELGGYYLSNKGSEDISHIYVGNFKNNSSQEAKAGFNPYRARPDLFGNIDVKVSFHTHLSRFGDSDRLRPSSLGGNGGDLRFKNRELKKNPLLKFLIITNPKPFYY
jgi:RHS repeat-associated protein